MQPGTVAAPPEGLWRIHRDPTALPQRPGPGEQPPNRFDDPRGDYRVRYLATNRRGAFLEVLARFRRSPETEERLGGVTEVDDALEPALPASVPPVFLQALSAARAFPPADAEFVDVADVSTQSQLGRHPAIRTVLDEADLGSAQNPAQLDEATIRLGGPRGRPITQAISRVVFEETTAAGIRYTSRIDTSEECWAVFEATPLDFDDPEPVALEDVDLREAAQQLHVSLAHS